MHSQTADDRQNQYHACAYPKGLSLYGRERVSPRHRFATLDGVTCYE